MPATRCTCMRDEATLALVAADPGCRARSHLWDLVQALDPYAHL